MTSKKTIDNDPFEMSYIKYDNQNYSTLLAAKVDLLLVKCNAKQFWPQETVCPMEIVESPAVHFRQRCRFAITHSVNTDHPKIKLSHTMWESGGPNILVDSFPIASIQIYNVMPSLIALVENEPEICNDLRAINYLSTSAGDLIATLVYERSIGDAWLQRAVVLHEQLLAQSIETVSNISIIGRSKGVKLVVGCDWVLERLHLADGRVLTYKQVDEGFSNPNSAVNAKVLDWLCDSTKMIHNQSFGSVLEGGVQIGTADANKRDLLEMFCGNGNHTVALAAYFRQVLAVEINKALCVAAEGNFSMNGVTNARVVACDSAQFALQIVRNKGQYAVKSSTVTSNNTGNASTSIVFLNGNKTGSVGDGDSSSNDVEVHVDSGVLPYDFSTVLVDPPRSGLDSRTCSMIAQYEHIMYISCQPDSLLRDLDQLCKTHTLVRTACFDHFAYTPHLECGVLLKKNSV